MACCAIADCGDPDCRVCYWSRIPQQPSTCAKTLLDARCRLVAGHPGPCSPPHSRTKTENVSRDGEIDIATEKSHDPTFQPAQAEGPAEVAE